LFNEQKIGFVVRRCVVDFFKPAKLDDLLTIETKLHDMNRVSLNMRQSVKLGKETLVELEIKLAVVDTNMKLAKLPEFVQKAMHKTFNH
jgi:acyl-CoA thioester hydrolase